MNYLTKRHNLILLLGIMLAAFLCLCSTSRAYGAETTSKYTGKTYTQSSALKDYIVVNGIDISNWQEDVDWAKIKADGIDFAIIRAGGRGFSAGTMYDDVRFVKNIQEAKANGLLVGVYFFSQAKTETEAQNEVKRSIKMIESAGYDASDLDLPLFMDYEMAGTSSTGRLYGVSKTQRTKVAEAWLEYAMKQGYTPGIYTDLSFSSSKVNGAKLAAQEFYWAAQYYTLNQFPFDYTWWQYASSGKVDGIVGGTDMNFWYIDPNCPTSLDTESYPTFRQMSGIARTAAALEGTAEHSMTECGVEFVDSSSFTYGTETKYEPSVRVTYGGNELILGTDYKVRYVNNTQAGTGYALVIGQGIYTDYIAVPFKIKAAKYSGKLTFSEVADQKYTGEEITPEITITDPNGKVLTKGTDYTVKYENNVNVGTASAIINFTGNYKGAHELNFNIVKATQKITIGDPRTETKLTEGEYPLGVVVKFETPITYTSSDPEVASVSEDGTVTPLKAGVTTITIKCATNVNFKSIKRQIELTVIDDTAEASEEPAEAEPDVEVTEIPITEATVEGIVSKVWNGKKRTQKPVITLNGVTLVKGTDYKLTYKNYENVGKATMTITGLGEFTGKITKTYKITPNKTKISKLTAKSKAVTVNWTKLSTKMSKSRITGYQVQRATDKAFTKNKKTVKVAGYKKTSYKFTGLKAKTTYYFRIRTYMTVDGKTYYSDWSGWKSTKTKK